MRATRRPLEDARSAALKPAGPQPTMRRSKRSAREDSVSCGSSMVCCPV